MSEPEVIAILGEPTSRRPEKQIPIGGPTGRMLTVKELVWEKPGEPKTQVTCGFADGRLIDGSGTIDGKRVNARRVASKITRENYQKIAARPEKNWTKAEITALLGTPSRNLGPQTVLGNFQSTESWEYSDGISRIVIHWMPDGRIGSEWHSR